MRNPGLDGPPSLRYMITSRVILAVLLTTALVGIFYASGNLEYTWRWNRVPQYFWAQGELETRVEHDAVVSDITQDATGITVLLTPQDAGVHPEEIRLPIDAKILADKGQDVYHGDTLARHPYSKPGILLEGLWVTIKVSVLAIMVGIFLGLGAGLCRISRDPALRWGAITYIEIIRGSPLLVQIFLWYFDIVKKQFRSVLGFHSNFLKWNSFIKAFHCRFHNKKRNAFIIPVCVCFYGHNCHIAHKAVSDKSLLSIH